MPGASGPKTGKKSGSTQSKSRSKSRSKALDAFALAEADVGPEKTRGVRTRDLEPSPEPQPRNKRSRGHDEDDEDEDEDDDEGENDTRMKKRARRAAEAGEEFDDPDMEMEEDSEGNEWHVGMGPDDEDSEIDSDDAFGEEDEAEFEEFAFRGSKSKKSLKKRKQEDEAGDLDEGDDDEDLESLGSEAIDLATALDQYSETDEEEAGGSGSSGSDEEDDSDVSSSDQSDSDDEDEEDPAARDALKSLISGFAGEEDEDAEAAKSTTGQKAKIGLKDLGLFGVKDPHIKKSLKLMNKEEKATKPGASKKLDIPLARRQQDKLLRSAAFEKASETLDRWTDTVKSNRRADHLFFPLAQNAHDAGLDNGELLPLNPKAAGTELEQTIMAIMEESGMGPSSKQKEQKSGDGEPKEPKLSKAERKELVNQRRREREIASRELARAKRIKKIKSKAYRRVHRKERLGDEEATLAAMKEAGEIDSEEEKEAQDRRRAMERMGSKHKESKWAKMGAKAGRAVWDDDFRSGLTDMARRDEELRKRVEGRGGADDDDDDDDDVSEASADSETERRRLLRDLDRAAADDGKPQSALMQMKFMQRGEEALRKANDELVEQIRRDLASDAEDEDEDQEQPDVGRRQYGAKQSSDETKPAAASRRLARAAARAAEQQQQDGFIVDTAPSKSGLSNGLSESQNEALGAAGAWSRAGQASRKGKKAAQNGPAEELDFSNAMLATTDSVSKPKKSQRNGKNGEVVLADGASSDEEDGALHLPMAIRDTELIKRAFAGEDVVGEFQREKAEVADEDDDKEVDNTLPGWGSWVGEGVSKKQKQKHAGRFITKVEGVKKKDRKDWKLERVIVNERRVRKVSPSASPYIGNTAHLLTWDLKNDKYLASQLPHPFESRLQYERSLRLPVGPEWVTKESFQDATKPRVILKPGVIAPMSKPMV